MDTVTDAELVHLIVEGGIATITLDSPHNRNALSSQLVTELTDRLRAAHDDASARAVVLTHSGTTFCSGADLSEARSGSMSGTASTLLMLIRAIIDLDKPVIAKIDGNARAGGLGLIAACDIVVAGPGCSFALTEVRLGLAAAVISVALLPRIDARAAGASRVSSPRWSRETSMPWLVSSRATRTASSMLSPATKRRTTPRVTGAAVTARLIQRRRDAQSSTWRSAAARLAPAGAGEG